MNGLMLVATYENKDYIKQVFLSNVTIEKEQLYVIKSKYKQLSLFDSGVDDDFILFATKHQVRSYLTRHHCVLITK